MKSLRTAEYNWLRTGEAAMEEMLTAIGSATESVRLEMYIFHSGPVADDFRNALVKACERGVLVRVLIDAFGSAILPDSFWQPLRDKGGQFRWFNPLSLHHIFIRDHRKMVVCDGNIAFIGGLNIATEYRGDGVTTGWRDLGLQIRGSLAAELGSAFDDMFACADFKHKPFTRLRKSGQSKTISTPEASLLLGGPGRSNPLKRTLRADLERARQVLIVSPYFIPPRKIRRILTRLGRTGAKVQLILPHKCDLPWMRMAAQSLYRRFLSAGVEIYEYHPQILHAKLFIIDDVVYAGSANMDARSMNINYELMVRLSNSVMVEEARQIFAEILEHSRRVELIPWRRSRSFLDRIKGRVAHLFLGRLDSFFAKRQFRSWKLSLEKLRLAKRHKTAGDTT